MPVLGFDRIGGESFRALALSRFVELVSKLDTIRVLGELGVTRRTLSRDQHSLACCAKRDYRAQVTDACWAHESADGAKRCRWSSTTLGSARVGVGGRCRRR